jgi:hypothetical protein
MLKEEACEAVDGGVCPNSGVRGEEELFTAKQRRRSCEHSSTVKEEL